MGGKSERRKALGPDYRAALKALPGAVAAIQHEIALAERRAAEAGARPVTIGRYPLAPNQIALRNYQSRLAFDQDMRNSDHRYASFGYVDEAMVATLREGIAGRLANSELAALVGDRIERFRGLGNTTAEVGSPEWRTLALALCISEYEALARVAERDEGDFNGTPAHPMLTNAQPEADPLPPVSLKGLFADYISAKKLIGKAKETESRWKPVFADLTGFIGHDDARRLTKQNLLEWRDDRLKRLSAKTIADVYLAAVRTVLTWAVENDRLESNVAERVRQDVPKKALSRERGFTLPEAVAVLQKARDHVPIKTNNPRTTEASQTTAAKRWSPILCAFTGARITEITQLRKQDFRMEGDIHIMRITPDAGTVKAGGYRDVPLHSQVVDLGFMRFVEGAPYGPLFYPVPKESVTAARTVAGRVSQWLQSLGIIPEGVSPNHGWRHRFKTVGRELEISDRVLDAIQGHAGKTAGDNYGDVTLAAKKAALDKFPFFDLPSA
ncbi:MAG: integrase [Mesorhizobium sp.]|nr:MAG: integrase [Mesorhizobium sp.]TIW05697.1 MAG: integrase [Mesorhizobium sp.]